jgi:predicted Ser/Thr protein kinase
MLEHIGEGGDGKVYYNSATGSCTKTSLSFNNAPVNDFIKEATIQIIAAKAGISPAVLSFSAEHIEMTYINSVTLDEYRATNGSQALEAERQKILKTQLELGIINHDSHLQNFLVDKQDKLWLIDFGKAQLNTVP